MALLLDDNTKMVRDSAQKFLKGTDSLRALRHRRDMRDLGGLTRGAWDGLVELGFSGMLVPEKFGGSDLDFRASTQVSEMMGSTLSTGPFLSTAVMAATALRYGDNEPLKAAILPRIVTGMVVAIAGEETSRHDPHAITTSAGKENGGFRISGRKSVVIDGNIAEKLIVVARSAENSDQLLMLLVDAAAPGVAITTRMGVDSHPMVAMSFDDVAVAQDQLICGGDPASALLDRIYDAGRLHLAAEMLGAAQEAFDRTLSYLKTRVQFGRRIGEFQALQHRAAILFGELEIARSTLPKAAGDPSAEHVSLAKAKIGEVAKHVTTEAVQLHGGIGVTDDFDIGFFLKRVRAASERLGDPAFHAGRYAAFQGL